MWCLPFLFWILNYTSQTHFLIQTHLMLKIYTYTIFGRKKKKDHFNRMWCLHFSIFDVKLPFLEFTTAFVSCSVSFRVECIPNSIIIVHQYHVFFFFTVVIAVTMTQGPPISRTFSSPTHAVLSSKSQRLVSPLFFITP